MMSSETGDRKQASVGVITDPGTPLPSHGASQNEDLSFSLFDKTLCFSGLSWLVVAFLRGLTGKATMSAFLCTVRCRRRWTFPRKDQGKGHPASQVHCEVPTRAARLVSRAEASVTGLGLGVCRLPHPRPPPHPTPVSPSVFSGSVSGWCRLPSFPDLESLRCP